MFSGTSYKNGISQENLCQNNGEIASKSKMCTPEVFLAQKHSFYSFSFQFMLTVAQLPVKYIHLFRLKNLLSTYPSILRKEGGHTGLWNKGM